MKLYKTPTKTTITVDAVQMLEDLRNTNTLYFPKSEFPAIKSLVAYMRQAGMMPLRPAIKAVTFIENGVEIEAFKVTLVGGPVRQLVRKDSCRVVRIADGVIFKSLNLAMQATDMPSGAKNLATVQKRIDAGRSLFEASNGAFTLTTE